MLLLYVAQVSKAHKLERIKSSSRKIERLKSFVTDLFGNKNGFEHKYEQEIPHFDISWYRRSEASIFIELGLSNWRESWEKWEEEEEKEVINWSCESNEPKNV